MSVLMSILVLRLTEAPMARITLVERTDDRGRTLRLVLEVGEEPIETVADELGDDEPSSVRPGLAKCAQIIPLRRVGGVR
jgi:hypothetical protein